MDFYQHLQETAFKLSQVKFFKMKKKKKKKTLGCMYRVYVRWCDCDCVKFAYEVIIVLDVKERTPNTDWSRDYMGQC